MHSCTYRGKLNLNGDLVVPHVRSVMACSTCHVIVDPSWYEKVGTPPPEEIDMIDLAYGPTETSRLGCQIKLSIELDGMVVTIPDGANNIFDPIPFKD